MISVSFRRFVASCVCLLAAFLLFTASSVSDPSLPNFWDTEEDEILATRIVHSMTDEELLAQILMFGWAGADPSSEVIAWVEKRSLGSIKVFGWNTDNTVKVAESVSLLQTRAQKGRFSIPLFVATDQEGGWIRHIKGKTSETPGNLAIGASGMPADAWYSGYYISRELAALGINLNFAPTVDLYTDHDSTVIGPRSFGEDPEAAGVLGAAFMSGSRAAGVLTTAKHFPGHGDTGLDSHGKLPVISISTKTLYARELVPFTRMIEAGVPAIMSGHLAFPSITGTGEPATFSTLFLKDILRDKLGFTGLVITDDIMMNGATEWAGSVSRAVQLAIEAGNDIVESSTTPRFSDPLWTGTLKRMKTAPAFRSRVVESALRVLKTKLAYFKGDSSVPVIPNIAEIPSRVPDPAGQAFFLSQAVRSVTLIRGTLQPIEDSPHVLIASSFPSFLHAGTKRFPQASLSGINSSLRSRARRARTVIFCLSGKEDLSALESIRDLDINLIVVSALSPVPLSRVPWVDTALAVYSYSPWSFTAAFASLRGDFVPQGTLPLRDLN